MSEMSSPNPPEEFLLLVAGYILGDLSPEEYERLQELEATYDVASIAEEMQRCLELTYDLTEIEPSPRLRRAVMSAAGVEVADRDAIAPVPIRLLLPVASWPHWNRAVAAVATVAIVSNLVLWRSLQWQQAQTQAARQALQAQTEPTETALTVSLQPIESFETAPIVRFQADPETLEATLTIENLPPLAPGQVYVLWTVLTPDAPFTTDAKGAILTEVFAVEERGDRAPQARTFRLPPAFQQPEFLKAIAVTVEDADAPQRHDAAPILIQEL